MGTSMRERVRQETIEELEPVLESGGNSGIGERGRVGVGGWKMKWKRCLTGWRGSAETLP